ncbi:MAG: acetyl-CoA hydrolase/transferase family protein [Deltaproteobacteria bacterium]|nr:acetyl-CoA hydrolase/transferase family protein [Deltaproteobacteria bacterium]
MAEVNARGEYAAKLATPAAAVSSIASGSKLSMGMGVSEPPALLAAIADRVRHDALRDLRVYYFESKEHAKSTILAFDLLDRIAPHCMFLSAIERELMRRAEERTVIHFVPNHFSQSARFLSEHVAIDTFVVTVSPMDEHGYFTFGTNNDYGSQVARSAKRLIVEVNPRMPRVFGDSLLHVAEVDAIVEHDAPLLECAPAPVRPVDDLIGRRIAELVPNGAVLQMGIGAVPNAVCRALVNHQDLGIHTELLTPGLVDLIERGVVTNRLKALNRRKTVFTFAMGDARLYDFINDNPGVESYPVSYVNDPAIVAQLDNVVSVNATLEMDLFGACNSEFVAGQQYSGAGGQVDFVRGAYASRGGKSIIAFQSTAQNGSVSRIVPKLSGPVTTPRTDTHFAVTEHGVFDLKGKSVRERALGLIAIASPRFRDELLDAAKKMRLV